MAGLRMHDVPGNWQGRERNAEFESRASWERTLRVSRFAPPGGLNRRALGELREDCAARGLPEVHDATYRGTGGKALGGRDRYHGDVRSPRILTFALLPHVPPVLWHHSAYLRDAPPRG